MPTLAHVVATALLLLPAPVVGFVVPMKCLAIGQKVGMHKVRYDQAGVLQMSMSLPEEPAANKGDAERATTDTSRSAFVRQQGDRMRPGLLFASVAEQFPRTDRCMPC